MAIVDILEGSGRGLTRTKREKSMKTAKIVLIAMALVVITGGCADDRSEPDDEYVDRLADAHQADTAEAAVHAMQPVMPVSGGPVTYTSASAGTIFTGYEVAPESADSAREAHASGDTVRTSGRLAEALPGIILIHEWWGLNDNMRKQAEQLAGEGYRVLAVDLFGGAVAEGPEEARGLAQQSMRNQEATMVNLVAAFNHLSQTRGAPRVGVMGYCFGGAVALNAGLALSDELDALVIYYGNVSTDSGELEALDMPILGIFGAEDESIPVETVRSFEEALADAGKDAEVHVYDGAGHAFANPEGANYEPEAAIEAWEVTTEFLASHLQNGR